MQAIQNVLGLHVVRIRIYLVSTSGWNCGAFFLEFNRCTTDNRTNVNVNVFRKYNYLTIFMIRIVMKYEKSFICVWRQQYQERSCCRRTWHMQVRLKNSVILRQKSSQNWWFHCVTGTRIGFALMKKISERLFFPVFPSLDIHTMVGLVTFGLKF